MGGDPLGPQYGEPVTEWTGTKFVVRCACICPLCQGTGFVNGTVYRCRACNGTGTMWRDDDGT